MAKMEFTFWWGRSKLADKNWVSAMLQYYLKVEDFNERIKEYVTKLELADILQDYVTHEELNANNEHFDELIEQIQNRIQEVINKHTEDITQISNDLHNFENEVETLMQEINAKLDKNTADISTNKEQIANLKQQQKDLVEEFKKARLWNQKGLWNAQETYKIGDVVGYEQDKTLYVSVTEPNIGNTPSKDSLVWFDLSGVQSIEWDDYYTKLQVDALVQNNTALIKALETRVNTNRDNISTNTRAISTLDSKVNLKANQSDLNALKTTVDTKANKSDLNNYVTIGTNQTISGIKSFNNNVNIGSDYKLGFGTNYIQDSKGGDSLKITFANGKVTYLGSDPKNNNDYTTKSYVDINFQKKISRKSYKLNQFTKFFDGGFDRHSNWWGGIWRLPIGSVGIPSGGRLLNVTFDMSVDYSQPWYRQTMFSWWYDKAGYIVVKVIKIYDSSSDFSYWGANTTVNIEYTS